MEFDVDYMAAPSWDGHMRERLERLRETHPIYWSETNQLWVLTKFEDVSYASKNHAIFCSGQGVRPGNPAKLSLIDEDEPRHTQLRRLLNRGFTPRMTKKLEGVFRGLVDDAIDAIAKQGECDFVDDLAVPMPLLLIAEMIGIRKQDRRRFHQWSDALIAGDGNLHDPEIRGRAAQAFVEYTSYIKEIFEERRGEPRDDLVSILLKARDEGLIGDIQHHDGIEALGLEPAAIADDEITMMMVLLLVAGNETTRNGLSGGMELLIRHPDQRRKLIDDPSLIPAAIEEMLRFVSPIQSFGRTVTRDTELRGTKLAAGDTVLMIYPAANRDPDAFENPEVFDVERNPHHLAFGIGNHFCMGANLARMEMRVAFAELLRRLPDMEFSRGGPEITPSSLVRTCAHMWVKYTPEA
jgi:cytochrome P450 family 142 subfamily A polypeptide 1